MPALPTLLDPNTPSFAANAGRKPVAGMGLPAHDDALRLRLDAESTARFGTAQLWDDSNIDPRDTRRLLSRCLDILRDAAGRTLRPNNSGVARLQETAP